MTRSLGDLDLKAYGVSATPDTSTMAIKHGKDAFLALISDGISFVMSNQEIGNCIATCEDAQEAAQALCDQVSLTRVAEFRAVFGKLPLCLVQDRIAWFLCLSLSTID